ncbi:XK-related protein 9 [Collichthys lucidus]|uniref:XK-related protein n=1 Tax=Collichthys lucidus TaxID=240159 RepID=A0A4U5VIX2_COLLU|nr:XK-related protein 9 [Collichthys lucidus]
MTDGSETAPENQYTKLRWLLTIAGLIFYVVDIWTDVLLALKYFQEKHFVWTGLTLMFVLAGLLVTQIFSYAWYSGDMNDPEEKENVPRMSRGGFAALHVFGMGIFTRYYHLLKQGFKVVWTSNSSSDEEKKAVHHKLFCLAADLSMLKLFESFIESVPQLLLQLYIVMGRTECSVMQCLSMVFSFFNVAWALVDYRRCLRRSLPQTTEMPSGLPTAVYLFYKLCTITSHILSCTLLLILSTYSTIVFTILWLLGTIWAHSLKTNFCSSRGLEFLYRAVIGVILTFTFFNVKGQNTRAEMIIYYLIHSYINMSALILLALFKPELMLSMFLLTVIGLIVGCSVLGLVFLVLYYLFLHPKETEPRVSDEVDGPGNNTRTKTNKRISNFIQP